MESLRRICLGLLYARNELPFSEGWLIFTCVCVFKITLEHYKSAQILLSKKVP